MPRRIRLLMSTRPSGCRLVCRIASHLSPCDRGLLTSSIGSFSELLRVPDEAMHAYERALQANPNSAAAMNAIGMLLKGREAYDKALEFFRAIVQLEPTNGEAWGNLGKHHH